MSKDEMIISAENLRLGKDNQIFQAAKLATSPFDASRSPDSPEVFLNRVSETATEVSKELAPKFTAFDEVAAAISSAPTTEQKLQAFLESDLLTIASEMESPNADITEEEAKQLLQFNQKLKQIDLNLVFASVLAAKREVMLQVNVDSARTGGELQHVKDVTALLQKIDPENRVGMLIAMVHDMYKQRQNGTELALHELVSTELGSRVLVLVLQKIYPNKFTQEELRVLEKLAKRATFTHGAGEFPEKTATEISLEDTVAAAPPKMLAEPESSAAANSTSQLTGLHPIIKAFHDKGIAVPRLLGSSLYYKPITKKTVPDETPPHNLALESNDMPGNNAVPKSEARVFVDKVIAVLNTADALTGNEWFSFVKYNFFYNTNHLVTHYVRAAETLVLDSKNQVPESQLVDTQGTEVNPAESQPSADQDKAYQAARSKLAGQALLNYFNENLTASFAGNMEVESMKYLMQQGDNQLQAVKQQLEADKNQIAQRLKNDMAAYLEATTLVNTSGKLDQVDQSKRYSPKYEGLIRAYLSLVDLVGAGADHADHISQIDQTKLSAQRAVFDAALHQYFDAVIADSRAG